VTPTKITDNAVYKRVSRNDVPKGRNGKHKGVITRILKDLSGLKDGMALKIELVDLPDTKENIRSALNRATRKTGLKVSTAADEKFLYVWNHDHE
jgi:hypothetical protein